MFQFRRFPTYAYLIQRRLLEYCSSGFPHSEISGSKPMCGSPKLIAACHVLHRLLMPRHSPCALISLTYRPFMIAWFSELCRPQIRFIVVLCYPSFQKVHKLLCYLSVACSQFIIASLFSFQGAGLPTSFKVRLKCSDVCPNTSI